MSTRPALAYNDAEKGTLDVPQVADLAKSDKKAADLDVFTVQSLKKDAPVTPSNVAKLPPSPAKPAKKKTPLWVLWVIWYNSYRYIISRPQVCWILIYLKAVFYGNIYRKLHRPGLCDCW